MLVTAAFIGPGTVLTCSKAGASYGYGLLWVLVLATLATIVFQEMAARLGIVTRKDLARTLRERAWKKWLVIPATLLMLVAILFGNAAYQAGNLTGTAEGLAALTGVDTMFWVWTSAVTAALILMFGRMQSIQLLLTALVGLMSVLFVACALWIAPDWKQMAYGLVVPRWEPGSLIVILGLLGTTVVPYNLFLHSRSAISHWSEAGGKDDATIAESIRESRKDSILAISIGGLISMAILITAAGVFYENGITLDTLPQIAGQLTPLVGRASHVVFCLGLFSAGFTSAITAPLAAGIVAAGCLGWGDNLADWRTRAVMLGVIAAGVAAFTIWRKTPVELILIAQVANGLILPIVALFLVVAMNARDFPRRFRNGPVANVLAIALLLIVSLLAWRQFLVVWKSVNQEPAAPTAPATAEPPA
jgi:NRAMP (natural resistance-associated macrophage protein)-like metal ion transporter